jgi:hypothetical protein
MWHQWTPYLTCTKIRTKFASNIISIDVSITINQSKQSIQHSILLFIIILHSLSSINSPSSINSYKNWYHHHISQLPYQSITTSLLPYPSPTTYQTADWRMWLNIGYALSSVLLETTNRWIYTVCHLTQRKKQRIKQLWPHICCAYNPRRSDLNWFEAESTNLVKFNPQPRLDRNNT